MYAKRDDQVVRRLDELMMDGNLPRIVGGKPSRPTRNKRHASRKTIGVGQRTVKRLFTPEIKRFLKEWLIRRRDNPYPNRDEKKRLATETGLTYIQICNWFANWRRKLKNASNECNKKTWAHLIKTYNSTARGNVEQFSICSEDSIWEEADPASHDSNEECEGPDHCYATAYPKQDSLFLARCDSESQSDVVVRLKPQCYQVSSTTGECKYYHPSSVSMQSINKYKSHIMEKYLQGLKSKDTKGIDISDIAEVGDQPILLTKWLESAANFQPNQSNYITWFPSDIHKKIDVDSKFDSDDVIVSNKMSEFSLQNRIVNSKVDNSYEKAFDYRNKDEVLCIHGREEVEAAVALTRLAGLFRS